MKNLCSSTIFNFLFLSAAVSAVETTNTNTNTNTKPASSSSSSSSSVTLYGPTPDAVHLGEKQVVFFAGPDRSSEEEVVEFFHNHVNNGMKSSKEIGSDRSALKYWKWPHPAGYEGDFDKDIFSDLVLDTDTKRV